jgi:hypothetical protein
VATLALVASVPIVDSDGIRTSTQTRHCADDFDMGA